MEKLPFRTSLCHHPFVESGLVTVEFEDNQRFHSTIWVNFQLSVIFIVGHTSKGCLHILKASNTHFVRYSLNASSLACTPVTPVLRWWREEDEEFKTILSYISSSRPVRAT